MKVPGSCPLTEPQERSAEPKVEEKNSAKEARGLRYAEAAEELGTAGAAVAWAASGGSSRTFHGEELIAAKAMSKTALLVVDSAQLPSGLRKARSNEEFFNAAPSVQFVWSKSDGKITTGQLNSGTRA